MADRKNEQTPRVASLLRRSLYALAFAATTLQAAERGPLEVIVTTGAEPLHASAINEDGVLEANSARVENGIVYLEFDAAAASSQALTADAH